ncbi:hypothetical protein B7P43_G05194 [Cryptotermes secundus]|uniref:Chemosensory protein n=1 Tax=Cryptotermes secundus TaxID=105785 RepID=A0A2J7QAD8_9NEOP|nr:allergen Tha p 1 [Cryptotermes secundus]PNF25548.1 hypothetical protein B7P43_G05194 [Cryptotermes secundus]
MNCLVVASVACLVAVLSVCAVTDTEQLGSMDVEALASFGACLVDDASCSEKTSKLKGFLLHALVTKCSECTEPEKANIRKAMKALIADHPEVWQKIKQTLDPEGKRAEGFKKFLQGA